ncbi:MAG: tRNA lysidine(34) synthetase TilS [Clostridia bacterium]|nr:tRNA lysidine(34) synthetase TilS [Clostridia bacterium]
MNFSKTVEKPNEVWYNITVSENSETTLGNWSFSVTDSDPKTGLTLDYDKVGKKLILRSRKDGDRIAIDAHKHQKISDLLINRKVPKDVRNQALLVCNDKEVLAVYPYRIAFSAAVTKDTTRFLTIQRSDENEPH